ncbi:hypothetical protein ABT369_14105 [Dactylosporangium sp. NPDC000244]|uniref:hypothetical protein n=1 Tax=Dactylosporangium sp. NPDC000244 TaxID=3154365 RepID=UPI003331CC5D
MSVPDALPRRYRRLLLAYPARYRRRHGAEILTTLMDAAEPGRERPTAAEVRDIVAGGLRQRFRLPTGRVMVLAAVLSALIAGGLGAGLGSVSGWAVAGRPDDAVAGELLGVVAGTATGHRAERRPEAFGLRSRVIAQAVRPPHVTPDEAGARLAAAGWQVEPTEFDGTLRATRGGVEAYVQVAAIGSNTMLLVDMAPALPAFTAPLTVAGAVLGLAAGWLLAARIGYRLRRAPLWQRVAVGELAALAVLLMAWPTIVAWGYLVWPGPALTNAYAAYETQRLIPAAGLGLALAAVALATVIRKQARVATLP